MKAIRVIVYQGTKEWLERTLKHSISKSYRCGDGLITEVVRETVDESVKIDGFTEKGHKPTLVPE